MTLSVPEVLEEAAELIERRGWAQLSAGMVANGPYCPLGAIAHAIDLEPTIAYENGMLAYTMDDVIDTPAAQALGMYVRPHVRQNRVYRPYDIYSWNDHPDQTKENVVAKMRAAAALYKRKTVTV